MGEGWRKPAWRKLKERPPSCPCAAIQNISKKENVYWCEYFIRLWFRLDKVLWRISISELCGEIISLLGLKCYEEPFVRSWWHNSINGTVASLTVCITPHKNSRYSSSCLNCEQRSWLSLEIFPLTSRVVLGSASKLKDECNIRIHGMTDHPGIIWYFSKRRDATFGVATVFSVFSSWQISHFVSRVVLSIVRDKAGSLHLKYYFNDTKATFP